MAEEKKSDIRVIFKVGAFLAFIMLSWLGIRSYKLSVEKVKTNACIEEIHNLSSNIRDAYANQKGDYGEIDYKIVEKLKLFPKSMLYKQGIKEATNAYLGGVDIYYSFISEDRRKGAFEISFQGLSSYACENLIKMDWGDQSGSMVIAVAGYNRATPAGPLEYIYPNMEQSDVKQRNIFIAKYAKNASADKVKNACLCKEDVCSVVWKFR